VRWSTANGVTVKNGPGAFNGWSFEYYSSHNLIQNCSVTSNGGSGTGNGNAGINTFGNFNQSNIFNNCTVTGNGNVQFYISNFDALGLGADSGDEISGGTFTGSNSVEPVLLLAGSNEYLTGAAINGPGTRGLDLTASQSTGACVNSNTFTAGSGTPMTVAINSSSSTNVGTGNALNSLTSNLTAGTCLPTVNAGATPTTLLNGLPPGLTLNTSTGQISGNPTTPGSYSFVVTVTDSASHTASQSYTVPIASATNVGCGVGTGGTTTLSQSTCGNYSGAPYEDLATANPNTAPTPQSPGTLHLISACTTLGTTVAGDVWRFAADINDGANGTNQNCIHYTGQGAAGFIIDLAGHTLTGGIKFDQTQGGSGAAGDTLVNGTINCNIANGGSTGCINIVESSNPTKSLLLSHLTVNNINSPANPDTGFVSSNVCQQGIGGTKTSQPYCGFEYAIYIETDGATGGTVPAGVLQKTFNGAQVEEAHLTVTFAAGYTGTPYPATGWCARCSGIYNSGTGTVTTEQWNNVVNNNAWVDAQQGIVNFRTGPASIHNNYFPWVTYSGAQDNGRAVLFDAAGKPFNQAGGSVYFNLFQIYNNRSMRTRQVNNVAFHDNRGEHVQGGTNIHMGGNDDYAEKLDQTVISHNTFVMEGGTAMAIRSAYGVTADSNTFVCGSSCNAGNLADVDLDGNYVLNIVSASRTSACVVTLTANRGLSTTSSLAGLFINVSGAANSSFNLSAPLSSSLTTRNGVIFTYTQPGCSGAASMGAGGTFWLSQNPQDAWPANGSQFYIKNSTIDPLLVMSQPLVACGTASPTCRFTPQALSGGQTQIKACNNLRSGIDIPAINGTGAIAQNLGAGTCP
jgi:hypothetical protein